LDGDLREVLVEVVIKRQMMTVVKGKPGSSGNTGLIDSGLWYHEPLFLELLDS